MARNRKNRDSGDEGGGASWMDTYGDLVTLLLCFFVLLFAMSEVDAEKFRALAGSFSGARTIEVLTPINPVTMLTDSVTGDPTEGLRDLADQNAQAAEAAESEAESQAAAEAEATETRELENNVRELYEHMSAFVEREQIAARVILIDEDYMVRLIISDMVFFRSGQATLLPEAYPILDKVIDMFDETSHLYRMLSIEGHTDNRPIHTAQFPSNWELSSHRALSVGSYIRAAEILPESRIQVLGFGEWHPAAPNDTPENMALNRRVEFVAETRSPTRSEYYTMTDDELALLTQTEYR